MTATNDVTIQAKAPIEEGEESAYRNSSRLYCGFWLLCFAWSLPKLISANDMDAAAVLDCITNDVELGFVGTLASSSSKAEYLEYSSP